MIPDDEMRRLRRGIHARRVLSCRCPVLQQAHAPAVSILRGKARRQGAYASALDYGGDLEFCAPCDLAHARGEPWAVRLEPRIVLGLSVSIDGCSRTRTRHYRASGGNAHHGHRDRQGPLLIDFRFWGFRWQFRAVPAGGLAFGVPRGGTWVRLRQTAYILGGPLANLLLIVVALALTGRTNAPVFDFLDRFSPGATLLFANAALVIGTLVPLTLDTSHGMLPSDGLLLWRVWRRSRQEIEAAIPYWYAVEAQDVMSQRKNAEAIVVLWQGLKEYPEDICLEQVRANSLLSQGKAAEA